MFNETSYKPAWKGRGHEGLPKYMLSGSLPVDRAYAPGFGPNRVVESPGFLAPDFGKTDPAVPVSPSAQPAAETSSGFDVDGILGSLTSLPWWVYAGAAYFLFFRKGRR